MESNILQKVESFNCRISDDVYWVPLETVGASQIKDRELQLLLKEPPEKKREHIRNLYDATALFVISNFHYCNDAVHLQDSEIVWEFHKSCYSAVKSNYGDCAACSSWLQYFVYGKYEDCGRLCMFRDTGSGHVVNYIKYAEWFYFVDFEKPPGCGRSDAGNLRENLDFCFQLPCPGQAVGLDVHYCQESLLHEIPGAEALVGHRAGGAWRGRDR